MSFWDRIDYKRPYKEGWAYILRKEHRTFRLVPFDPRTADSFEFENHKYKVDPDLMVRLKRYDPRLDNAKFGFGFLWLARWLSIKKIGILKFMEWQEGQEGIVEPEDHIEVIENHKDDELNPLRFKVTVLEQLANAAFKSIKQTQPMSRKWLIIIIVVVIAAAALLYFFMNGGASVIHAT